MRPDPFGRGFLDREGEEPADPNSTSPHPHHSAGPSHPGVGGRPAGHRASVFKMRRAAGDMTKDRAVLEAPLTGLSALSQPSKHRAGRPGRAHVV